MRYLIAIVMLTVGFEAHAQTNLMLGGTFHQGAAEDERRIGGGLMVEIVGDINSWSQVTGKVALGGYKGYTDSQGNAPKGFAGLTAGGIRTKISAGHDNFLFAQINAGGIMAGNEVGLLLSPGVGAMLYKVGILVEGNVSQIQPGIGKGEWDVWPSCYVFVRIPLGQ